MSNSNRSKSDKFGLAAVILLAAVAAVWILFDAVALQSAYQQGAKNRAQEYAQKADIEIGRRCRDLASPALANCVDNEREAAREGQRKEYDLEAQRTMAAWTRAMGIAAIIGMGVGLFGVWLIFTTFRETRRAADAAMNTLEANRAWVVTGPVQYTNHNGGTIDGEIQNDFLSFTMEWKNAGQSPATNTVCYTVAKIAPEDETPVFEFPEDMQEGEPSLGPLGPNSSVNASPRYVPTVNLDDFLNRRVALVYATRFTYEDVFNPGVRRVSEACIRIVCSGRTVNARGLLELNLAITPIGERNIAT